MLPDITTILWHTLLVVITFVIAVVGFISFRFSFWTKHKMNYYKKQGADFYYHPMIGHFYKMLQSFDKQGDFFYDSKIKARTKPERLYVSNIGSDPYVMLHDPVLIKEFCLNQDNYIKEPVTLDLFNPLLGKGLVKVEGQEWKLQKKMLSSSFHFEFLNAILPNVQKLANDRLTALQKESLKEIDLLLLMQNVSGEIVGKLFFGDEIENYRYEGKLLTQALADLIAEAFTSNQTSERFYLGPWLSSLMPKHKRFVAKIHEFRAGCLKFVEAREKVKEKNLGKKDMVQVLLEYDGEAGKVELSNIVDQFISFFLPGMDTAGHMLTMAVYYMAAYPQYKARMTEEVLRLYTPGKPITIEELNKFEFMNIFLKEVLRMSTPINDVFSRKAIRDHYLKDIHIKKNDVVNLDFFYNHFNPQYFKDPDTFNPDRWLEKDKSIDPYAYIPFSAGPKTCIGQHLANNEVKVILAELITMYDFHIQEGYELKMFLKFVYGPYEQIKLTLIPRNK